MKWVTGICKQILLATAGLALSSTSAFAQFDFVIESPPTLINETIARNEIQGSTQFNVYEGGTVERKTLIGGRTRIGKEFVHHELNVFGGTVEEDVLAREHVGVNITGGDIGTGFIVLGNANISGGDIGPRFTAGTGSQVRVTGGTFDYKFTAAHDRHVSLIGTDFLLDGKPIVGLTPGAPREIFSRDVELSGILANGTGFSFFLGSELKDYDLDYFSPSSFVHITLVPEPNTFTLAIVAGLPLIGLMRRCHAA